MFNLLGNNSSLIICFAVLLLIARIIKIPFIVSCGLIIFSWFLAKSNIPFIRGLYAASEVATVLSLSLFSLLACRFILYRAKEEKTQLLNSGKKFLGILSLAVGGLFVYAYATGSNYAVVFENIKIILIIALLVFVVFAVIRQGLNFIQLSFIFTISCVLSFVVLPPVQLSQEKSIETRAENALNIMMIALNEEHFDVPGLMHSLEEKMGAAADLKLKMKVYSKEELMENLNNLSWLKSLGGRARTIILSEEVVKHIESATGAPDKSRAQYRFDISESALKGLKSKAPVSSAKSNVFKDYLEKSKQNIYVLDQKGRLYQYSAD